jgi:histidyl-tRNA synthetase
MTSQNKLSLEPYKGTRDFYPKDQFIQNYIFSVWKKVCESFGYLEYGASILEETELYKSKSGEEIVNEQTYSFIDRGGRNVTIRPEMTPTVARMVAQKRKELSFPLRWFSIPNLFRYERPQRGRLREHWQLNADIFGVEGIEADAEIINLAYGIMKGFNAQDEQFVIHINSRKFLNHLLKDYLRLPEDRVTKTAKLLDRMAKLTAADFEAQGEEILGKAEFQTLRKIIGTNNLNDLPEDLQKHESVQELKLLFKKLSEDGIQNILFDIGIVRGFDYYTGTVFEVFDTSPENIRALFGGGRYDDLVSIFGVEKVSGVGFGVGDVTIRDFLETHSLLPEYNPPVQLYICHLEGYLGAASQLAAELRSQGLNVAVDLSDRKVSQQVKTADKELIPYIIVVGEEEVKSRKFKVKNLRGSNETEVLKENLKSFLLNE